MDMKKILSALDDISERTVQGTNDMKKFVSIIRESSEPVGENIISGFEEGSVGGDANAFLIAADEINDLVMSQVEKIKINADEASLRDMMEKFNAFMTAYHNVGKGILQPDMFNDGLGEGVAEGYPSDDDMGTVAGTNDKMTLGQWKQMWQKKMPNADMSLFRFPPNMKGSAIAYFDGWVNSPGARWDPVKSSSKGVSEDKKTLEGLSFLDYLNLAEATGKQKGVDGKACWDGYKRMGTKKKGGKTVDNCVPTGKK
jgi:hypothetical protein